LTFEFVMVWVF